MNDVERRTKKAAYMRQWNRSPSGQRSYRKRRKKISARIKAYRNTRKGKQRYLTYQRAYAQTEHGKQKNREKVKRYKERHPERVAASFIRYKATKKGKLKVWSSAASQRCRKTEHKRKDGRIRKTLGGTVTALQLRELWAQQNGCCALTGRKMILRNGHQHLDSPSVDRIDRKKGYVMGNIRLVIYQANCARLFGDDRRLRQFCRWILDYS